MTGDSLQNLRIRVVPGSGLVAVQGEVLLVVPSIGDGQEPALEALLAVAGAASLERAVARVVADFDDERVPPFCLVAPGEVSGLFALVHGELELSAEGTEGGARLRGREARTWVDRLLPGGLTRLAVTVPDDVDPTPDPYVDLRSGVVRGAGVLITQRDASPAGEVSPAPHTKSAEAMQADTPERDTPNSAPVVAVSAAVAAEPATDGPESGSGPGPAEPTATWTGPGRDPGARGAGFRPEPIRFGQGGRMESMAGRPVNGHDGQSHGRRAAATATAEPGTALVTDADEEVTVVDLTAVEAAEAAAVAAPAEAEVADTVTEADSEAAAAAVGAPEVTDTDEDEATDETDAEDDDEAEADVVAVAAPSGPAEDTLTDLADTDRQDARPERTTSPLSTSSASAALAASAAVALEHAREQARLRARELAAGASSRDRDVPEPPTVKTFLNGRADPFAQPPAPVRPAAAAPAPAAPAPAPAPAETVLPADPDDEVPFYARTQIVPPPSAGRNVGIVPPPPSALDPFGAPAPKAPVAPDALLAEPPAPRPMRGRLVIENAEDVVVDRDCVIGRNPEVDPDVAQGKARAVTLPDAEQRISRVHARLLLTDRGVDIVDAGSVNGTWIEPPGAVGWIAMVPRVPAPLPLGSRIQVGDLVLAYEAAPLA